MLDAPFQGCHVLVCCIYGTYTCFEDSCGGSDDAILRNSWYYATLYMVLYKTWQYCAYVPELHIQNSKSSQLNSPFAVEMLASADGAAVKSFHIFKDDNFSQWRLTRELLVTADAYASSGRECYHAVTRATVPFMWESQPGTPKHRLHQIPLPPLTPPPSFFSISVPTKKMTQSRKSMFPKFSFIRSRHSVRLSTSSETPLSSSPSMQSSPITPLCDYYYSRRYGFTFESEKERKHLRSSLYNCSPFLCFGSEKSMRRNTARKSKGRYSSMFKRLLGTSTP